MYKRAAFLIIAVVINAFFVRIFSQTFDRGNAVLSHGNWYKLGVVEDGIYKLTYANLEAMGVDVAGIDPERIKVFGHPEKMLTQHNGVDIPLDLSELAIEVVGGEDGSFDQSDFLLFYGQSPHTLQADTATGTFYLQKNYYADTTFYFLNAEGSNGKRPGTATASVGNFPEISTFDDAKYLEEDKVSRLESGREWLGDLFRASTNNRTYGFDVNEIANNSLINIVATVFGESHEPATFTLSVDNFEVGNLAFGAVADYRYALKAVQSSDTFSVVSSLVKGNKIEVGLKFNAQSGARISQAWLDKLIVCYERELKIYGDQQRFRSLKSVKNDHTTFTVQNPNPGVIVWDITNPFIPLNQKVEWKGGTSVSFATNTSMLREFVAFYPDQELLIPAFGGLVENQNLKGSDVPDLLIVSNDAFLAEAQRLAAFRRSHDQMDVLVVSTSQLFNEYSSGRPEPAAIRNFVRYLYHRQDAPDKLKYLLLFGKGTFDYKDVLKKGRNFVPIYQSRNSFHPLLTYGSDDFYGFLESHEGDWEESLNGDHSMDIGVGRLPVKSLQEAEGVVSKIINYSSGESTLGDWRTKVLFVADDGDFNIHHKQSYQLAQFVDTAYAKYNSKKVFLDSYDQPLINGYEKSPDMTEALKRAIDDGALIVNFTGHGGEHQWMQEKVLEGYVVETMENYNRLPLFVTATCEYGRHDNPADISAGELTVLNPKGGGIAMVTTSRPVLSSANFKLNKAFYKTVFSNFNGRLPTLGEVFYMTKNSSLNGVSNRNFSLLGDPSMTLAYPEYGLRITGVNQVGKAQTDTLNALSHVRLTGMVEDLDGSIVADYSGVVNIELYDKQYTLTTLGNENDPFSYDSWENRIFSGKASVINGSFNVEFIVPKNIAYNIGQGKIAMYAQNTFGNPDAAGSALDLRIGGSGNNPDEDRAAPYIGLFMNDSTFIDGGITSMDPYIYAQLFDESGINISGAGVGQGITAVLDGHTTYDLNEYYSASIDDFRSGDVRFPLYGLATGTHTIQLKVWDTYNNYNEATVEFVVVSEHELVLAKWNGSPNPFSETTKLFFEHNKAGEDIKVWLHIYSVTGKLAMEKEYLIENSPSVINLDTWNGKNFNGQKLEKGLYIASVSAISLKDGLKNKAFCKLIYLY